jgi:DNA-binding phage protein
MPINKISREKMRRAPLRGVISEIAREQGVTAQAVWDALYVVGNPRIIEIATKKVSARTKFYNKAVRGFVDAVA